MLVEEFVYNIIMYHRKNHKKPTKIWSDKFFLCITSSSNIYMVILAIFGRKWAMLDGEIVVFKIQLIVGIYVGGIREFWVGNLSPSQLRKQWKTLLKRYNYRLQWSFVHIHRTHTSMYTQTHTYSTQLKILNLYNHMPHRSHTIHLAPAHQYPSLHLHHHSHNCS